MPVVGMIIKNMNVKKTSEYVGPSNIGHKTGINSVEETTMKTLGKKGLKLGFEFNTIYNDEKKKPFGEITITGDVFFLSDNPAEILMSWKKDKKLPEDVNLQAINTVIRRCMSKAIMLSEDVNLPPPIPIPFAQKQHTAQAEDKSRYIG